MKIQNEHLQFHIKDKAGQHFSEQSKFVEHAILHCKAPCSHQLLRGREHSASNPTISPFSFDAAFMRTITEAMKSY